MRVSKSESRVLSDCDSLGWWREALAFSSGLSGRVQRGQSIQIQRPSHGRGGAIKKGLKIRAFLRLNQP